MFLFCNNTFCIVFFRCHSEVVASRVGKPRGGRSSINSPNGHLSFSCLPEPLPNFQPTTTLKSRFTERYFFYSTLSSLRTINFSIMLGKRITKQQKCQIKTNFFIASTFVEHGLWPSQLSEKLFLPPGQLSKPRIEKQAARERHDTGDTKFSPCVGGLPLSPTPFFHAFLSSGRELH